MKTYYHKRLIDNAEPELVYDQFGAKYLIPKGGGKTIEMRRYGPLHKALKPLTEGVTPNGDKLDVTALTATVEQYGNYIELSDMLEMTAIDPNVDVSLELLASQAGRTLDTITRDVVCAGTNKMFAPRVAADGTQTDVWLRENVTVQAKLTPAMIRKAVAKLKRVNAKPLRDGYYVAVIHPDVACDIMGDHEWVEAHKYTTSENIYEGEIGRIAKCRFVETTEAKIIGPDFFWGNADNGGVCRMTLATALDGTGSTTIVLNEAISAAEAAELNGRLAGETVKCYVGGKEAQIKSVTAGAGGAASFTVASAVTNVEAGAVVCGYGAGKDGSAIYCTMVFAANAYGVTEIQGMGLEHIVKQKGSAGTADPLNQRSTVGWKATKVAERLVEDYMIRIEHSSETYGANAKSN